VNSSRAYAKFDTDTLLSEQGTNTFSQWHTSDENMAQLNDYQIGSMRHTNWQIFRAR